jgi:hypothetical protein
LERHRSVSPVSVSAATCYEMVLKEAEITVMRNRDKYLAQNPNAKFTGTIAQKAREYMDTADGKAVTERARLNRRNNCTL